MNVQTLRSSTQAPRVKVVADQLLLDERSGWRPDGDGFWLWTCPSCKRDTHFLSPLAHVGAEWRELAPVCSHC